MRFRPRPFRALRPGRAFALAAFLIVSPIAFPETAPPELRAEFWLDLDGIQQAGEAFPLADTEAARRVLDEAAWVFAGMINGFDFEWVPENRGRQVTEGFRLTALGAISPGDPRLQPGESRRDLRSLRAWIGFQPDEADRRSVEGSKSATWKTAQGRGQASWMLGWPGRREAYVAAIKDGLESWARSVEAIRPRLVRGRLVFASVPTLAIVDGSYVVQARLRLEVAELLRWTLW